MLFAVAGTWLCGSNCGVREAGGWLELAGRRADGAGGWCRWADGVGGWCRWADGAGGLRFRVLSRD
jgi:hypothetical protein